MPEQELHRLKRNRAVFDRKWKTYVRKELNGWSKGGVTVRRSAQEEIWTAYYAFNEHCVENYLGGGDTLDRYQVAACYLCAILAARPLMVEKLPLDDVRRNANEYAAIHIACSILAGFTLEAIDESQLSEHDKAAASTRVREGLLFDSVFPAGHETYLMKVLTSLQFTAVERRYNLLQTALLMYHWEMALVGDSELFAALVTGRPYASTAAAPAAVEVQVKESPATAAQAPEAAAADASAANPQIIDIPVIEASPAEAGKEGSGASSDEKAARPTVIQLGEGEQIASATSAEPGEKGSENLSNNTKVVSPVPARERVSSGRLSQRERLRERKG